MSFLASSVHRSFSGAMTPFAPQLATRRSGTFHDQVGCAAALDGGVHLIVAVGVVQILHGHLDVGVLCVEAGDQLLHGLVIAPAADGVCPQLDACAVLAALAAAEEAVEEAAVLVEAEEPPQAASAPAAPRIPAAFRNERREMQFFMVDSPCSSSSTHRGIVLRFARSGCSCLQPLFVA